MSAGNLRYFSNLTMLLVISVCSGTETVSFLDSIIWDIIPSEIKGKEGLEALKCVIKNGSQKIIHVDCANVIYLELDLSNRRL